MTKIGRNGQCYCGSGKKYKRCHLAQDSSDLRNAQEGMYLLQVAYAEQLTYVVNSIPLFSGELNQLFYKIDQNEEIIPSRMQLIGVFTIIEVLANYWCEYMGNSKKPSERFNDYLLQFCLTERNRAYASRRYLNTGDPEKLVRLRNGLIHFYGLAGNEYIILPAASKGVSQEDIDASHRNFTALGKIRGIEMIFIQPFELKEIVVESAVLILEYLKDRELYAATDDERTHHTRGVIRIYNKLKKEGASLITKETARQFDEKMKSEGIIK